MFRRRFLKFSSFPDAALRFFICFLCGFSFTTLGEASTIYYAGSDLGVSGQDSTNAAIQWANANVPKKFDREGDGVFCTVMGTHWMVAGYNQGQTYNFVSSGSQDKQASFADVTKIGSPETMIDAGIALSGWTLEFTKDYDYVRYGIMTDLLGTTATSTDANGNEYCTLKNNKVMNVASAGIWGGGNSKLTVQLAEADGVPDIVFFDLIDVKAGERYSLEMYAPVSGYVGYIGPVMIDEVLPTAIQTAANAQTGWSFETANLKAGGIEEIAKLTSTESDTTGYMRLYGDSANLFRMEPNTRYGIYGVNADGTKQAVSIQTDASGNASGEFVSEDLVSVTASAASQLEKGDSILIDIQATNPNNNSERADGILYQGAFNGISGLWNEYNVPGHSNKGEVETLYLLDQNGQMTTASFTIDGILQGWTGNKNETSNPMDIRNLTGDYIFANAGNVGGEFDWIIDGLVPNDLYELTLLTGSVDSRSAYFSVNGEERLVDPNSSDTWLVQTTELGEILGIFASSNTGGEQNWSGLLLTYVGAAESNGVPEPSTAVLMLLSMAGGVFWLRRKTRAVRD